MSNTFIICNNKEEVKSNESCWGNTTFELSTEDIVALLDSLKEQKETGVILLPPYLEVQIVPEDIEIKLADGNGECVLIPSEDF